MKIALGSATALLALYLVATASWAQQATTAAQEPDNSASSATEPPEASSPPSGTSQVRIVRLSQVIGEVQLDRNTNRGFEAAFPNLPIAQGERLKTNDGAAEVEFEDNSSLRITPNSLIEFPTLQRTPAGTTTNSIKLLKGILYVSLENTKGNEFTVAIGNTTITLNPSSHLRLDAGSDTAKPTLAVFNGTVQVADASGTTTVGKKKTLTLDNLDNAQAPPVLTGKLESQPFDKWDKNEMDYHKLRSISSAYGNSPYAYGINDLNYYGSFTNFAGCGSLWRPYFTDAAWSPFGNGVWAWYPGVGYSWVSPYPWGWTPFHYGSWQYCPTGGGWGWRPGNTWIGLANHPATLHPGPCPGCPKAPHRPGTGRPTIAVSNTAPLRISRVNSSGDFVFRKNSAGLGVPRESFGKLNRISSTVARHGFASTPVYLGPEHGPNGPNQGERNAHQNGSSEAYRTPTGQHRSNNASADSGHSNRSNNGASRSYSPPASSSGRGGGWSAGGGSRSSSASSSGGGWSRGGGGGGGGSHASSPSSSSSAGSNSHR